MVTLKFSHLTNGKRSIYLIGLLGNINDVTASSIVLGTKLFNKCILGLSLYSYATEQERKGCKEKENQDSLNSSAPWPVEQT